MLSAIQEHIVGIICSGVASFAAGTLVWAIKKFSGLFQAVKANSHDKLFRYGKFYILSGEITLEELESLEERYNGYHGLGGNGTGTEIFEKCKELPVVKERTKWNPYYVGKEMMC